MKRYFFIVAICAAALIFHACSFNPVSLIFPDSEYEGVYDGFAYVIISGKGKGKEISTAYHNAETDINEKLEVFLKEYGSETYRKELKKCLENRILFDDFSRGDDGIYTVNVFILIPKDSAPRGTIFKYLKQEFDINSCFLFIQVQFC